MTTLLYTLLTIAISAAGGFVGNLMALPGGWLTGGALAVAVAAVAGIKVTLPPWLRDTTFVFTGMSMGANMSRDSLALIAQWPVTLAAMAVELVLIVAVTGYMLRKLFGLDRGTAYLSSFPGHLSFIMGIAAAGVGDPRQITIIQVIRLMMLTTVVPVGALFLPVGHDIGLATSQPPVEWLNLGLVLLACAATGLLFRRLNVPAAFALGAMAASIVAKLLGLFEGSLPPSLLTGTYIMIGTLIGSRFGGITFAEFRAAATGGLIATAMTIAIVTTVAYGAAALVDMPFGQIWLGLAPGALEGMGALGIALGFDTAFIAAHHVARLLLLTVAIPVVALLVRQTERVKE